MLRDSLRGSPYKVPILDPTFFNSPPPLFFFRTRRAPISHLLYIPTPCDLFYLALWMSKAGVEIAHFNMSRLGVPNHSVLFSAKMLVIFANPIKTSGAIKYLAIDHAKKRCIRKRCKIMHRFTFRSLICDTAQVYRSAAKNV